MKFLTAFLISAIVSALFVFGALCLRDRLAQKADTRPHNCMTNKAKPYLPPNAVSFDASSSGNVFCLNDVCYNDNDFGVCP